MRLLDTSAVVDIDRGGVDRKVRKLDEQSRNAISMMTVTELRLGVDLQAERGTDHHQQALDDLDRPLARFDILPISRPVTAATIIATLRDHGEPLDDLHDIYIAATARTQ
jgi:tRNA(fMet)-specific endonuclease VapC